MRLKTTDFGLPLSLCCGQAFGWKRAGKGPADGQLAGKDSAGGWFFGFIAGRPVAIRQKGAVLEWKGRVSRAQVAHYLRLGDDLRAIKRALSSERALRPALNQARGLRILRQDPWECAVSFICSSYSNIPRITKMLDCLRRKWGERVMVDGTGVIAGVAGRPADRTELWSFPTPKRLAKASEKELKQCGLGYRAPYVKAFAEAVANGAVDFEELKRMPYGEAKDALLLHAGIGEKVADCALLFSLDHLEAFPVDVWIKRIMARLYAREIAKLAAGRKASDKIIREFAQARFGRNAGYAEQFLYAARKTC